MTWQEQIEKAVREAVQEGSSAIEIKAEVDVVWQKIADETAAAVYGSTREAR